MVFLSALLHLEVTAVPTISSGWVNRGLAGGIIGQVLADGGAVISPRRARMLWCSRVDGGPCSYGTVPVSLTALLQRVPTGGRRP